MSDASKWLIVFEGDSIDRFLGNFVLSDRQRDKIQKENPAADLSHLPADKSAVMQDIRGIWEQRGFLTPAETQAVLIKQYLPSDDARLHDFIHATELARNTPENVTGYLGKEHAYLATGLAHLYARETGMPVLMVEVDFSNMGGTNEYFHRMLVAEAGIASNIYKADVSKKDGEALTDRAVRLLSAGIVSDIAALHPDERIIPIRTGGDELRILVTGIDDPQKQIELSDILHANIERRVASMGLQDHPHLKDPEDRRRNGFGAALAVQDMGLITNSGSLIQELDARISETKLQLGMMRLGEIDREVITVHTEAHLRYGAINVPRGLTEEDVIELAIARAQKNARVAADALRDLNPVHNPELQGGIAGFRAYVSQTIDAMAQHAVARAALPEVFERSALGGEDRPAGVRPTDSLERRYVAVALEHFNDQGVALSATALHFLKRSVRGLSPEDPSAQVMMPRGMVRMLDNAAADAADFRGQFKYSDPDIQSAMEKAGLKSVSQIMPQALAVSVHNLAGLNSALGHHNADVVLRHIAHEVIGGAVHAAGVPRQSRASFAVAHHGGGNFSVLLPAGGTDAQGQPWFASQTMIHHIRSEIKSRIKSLNESDIAGFLAKNGGHVDGNTKQYLEDKDLRNFADVRDPKERAFKFGEDAIKGRVDGIHAVVVGGAVGYNPAEPGAGGGVFVSQLRTRADAMMEQLRAATLYHVFKTGGAAGRPVPVRPFHAAFNGYAMGRVFTSSAFMPGGFLRNPKLGPAVAPEPQAAPMPETKPASHLPASHVNVTEPEKRKP